MDISFHNKQAVVAGSTKGIGKAIAEELAKRGASLTLIARNEDALKTTLAQLPTPANNKHDYICADFYDSLTLNDKFADYLKTKKAVHILINNTGGPPPGSLLKASPEDLKRAFEAHVLCNQILTQQLVPIMREQGYGRIVNIISTSVKQPIKNLGVSNTIRGAVASWSKTLAQELGPLGITINNVLPGFTNTERLEKIIDTRVKKLDKSYQQIVTEMHSQVPLGRFAEPQEVAMAVVFLVSDTGSYINGINLPVDGGRTLCL